MSLDLIYQASHEGRGTTQFEARELSLACHLGI